MGQTNDLCTPAGVAVRPRQLWKWGPEAYSWAVARTRGTRVTMVRIPGSYAGCGRPRSVLNTIDVRNMHAHDRWGWRLVGSL